MKEFKFGKGVAFFQPNGSSEWECIGEIGGFSVSVETYQIQPDERDGTARRMSATVTPGVEWEAVVRWMEGSRRLMELKRQHKAKARGKNWRTA